MPTSNNISSRIFKRNFFAADYNLIVQNLRDVNWDDILSEDDVDCNINKFYNAVNNVIDAHVPAVQHHLRSYPKWYDEELINLIREKKRAHCEWKRVGNLDCYIDFKRLRALCIRQSRLKYQGYIDSVQNSVKRNIRSFWSFVNNNKKETGIPSNTFWNSTRAHNDSETTNLFAAFFGSVYVRDQIDEIAIYDPIHEISLSLSELQLNQESLRSIIASLENNVNSGPDKIPPYFVKKCWSAIEKPVSIIFNNILSSGYFPNMWKFSYILPIFKNGDKHDIKNYRPISIISCLPKVFDHLLTNELASRLLGKLSSFQHGFIIGRSTLTNILIFNEFLSVSLENRRQVDSIYTDF